MKYVSLTVAALSLLAAPVLVHAADPQAGNQPADMANPATPPAAYNANPNPTAAAPGTVQAAPADWTSLKGTVQAVDKTAKTLQIKDDSGNVMQVPVDKQVSIQKENGQSVKLSQVQMGDVITLAKKPGSSPGMKTY